MITFGAKYLSPVSIGKVVSKNEIVPYEGAILELEPDNSKDLIPLGLLSSFSLRKTGFACSIRDDFASTCDGKLYDRHSVQYFALTNPQDNYNFVRPRNIQGLAEKSVHPSCPDSIYLDYLQSVKKVFFNKYCFVGKGLLDFIKRLEPDKCIRLDAVPSAVRFYLDNGFKQVGKHDGLHSMIYIP